MEDEFVGIFRVSDIGDLFEIDCSLDLAREETEQVLYELVHTEVEEPFVGEDEPSDLRSLPPVDFCHVSRPEEFFCNQRLFQDDLECTYLPS